MQTLKVKTGSRYRAATAAEVAEVHGYHVAEQLNRSRPSLESPKAAHIYLRGMLAGLDHEVFVVIFVDNRHRLIAAETMFRGTINESAVYPREVAKVALLKGAAAVIFAHNHPSGVPTASAADEQITEILVRALGLFQVRVLDHIIIGSEGTYSFAEYGKL